jgi:hypothetical protein
MLYGPLGKSGAIIMGGRLTSLSVATIIGFALGVGLPANGQSNPVGPRSIDVMVAPGGSGLDRAPYLRVATPPPAPQDSWRDHVDVTKLAAANLLIARLRAARFDLNLQEFMNDAAALGLIIDQVSSSLPNNTSNASRAVQAQPSPDPQGRAYRHALLAIALQSRQAALRLQIQVAKAILDFKVATSPVAVKRLRLMSAVPLNRLANVVILDVGQETQLGVFLILTSPGGDMAAPRGIARSFLTDIGINDEELELMLTAVIRGTISDNLQPYLLLSTSDPRATRQRQIYETGLRTWLGSTDFVVHFYPEETGSVEVTHPDVVAFDVNPYLGLFANGGIRALAVNAGTTTLVVQMADAYKQLTSARDGLPFYIKNPDGPIRPAPSYVPLPNPNASPGLGPTPPAPGPAPSKPPPPQANLSQPYLLCTQLPNGDWANPSLCEPK